MIRRTSVACVLALASSAVAFAQNPSLETLDLAFERRCAHGERFERRTLRERDRRGREERCETCETEALHGVSPEGSAR